MLSTGLGKIVYLGIVEVQAVKIIFLARVGGVFVFKDLIISGISGF